MTQHLFIMYISDKYIISSSDENNKKKKSVN